METVYVGERKRPHAQVDGRLFGSIDGEDLQKVLKREKNEDWVFLCSELGDADLKYAQEQLSLRYISTARYYFWAAGAMYGLAQYGLTDPTEEKLYLYKKMNECNQQYGKLAMPPWQEVKIPYKDYDMDGWLMLPRNLIPKNPILLMIGGATAFKDQAVRGIEGYLMSGVAVLFMDGPGQGTTRFFNNGFLEVEVENAYSKMINFIEADGRFGKIGIQGGSTGGYYVARAAATDKRIAACGCSSSSYAPMEILNYQYEYRHKFAVLCGVTDDEMDDLFPKMTMEGLANKIECPLCIVHGQADPIFLEVSARKVFDEAKSQDKIFMAYPGAWHCGGPKAMRFLADWMIQHLKQ